MAFSSKRLYKRGRKQSKKGIVGYGLLKKNSIEKTGTVEIVCTRFYCL